MGYRSDVAMIIEFKDVVWNDGATEEMKKDYNIDGLFRMFLTQAEGDPQATQALDILKDKDRIEDMGDSGGINMEDRRIEFRAYDIKWYADYEEVKAFTRLFEMAGEWAGNESGIPPEVERVEINCAYARTGEDLDDNETEYHGYNPWDLLRIERSIVAE